MSSNTYLFILLTLFLIVVCFVGCLSSKHSKAPWEYVTKAIEKLNDEEEIRSYFFKNLEDLFQKHTDGSKEFYLKLADLIVDNATIISAKSQSKT